MPPGGVDRVYRSSSDPRCPYSLGPPPTSIESWPVPSASHPPFAADALVNGQGFWMEGVIGLKGFDHLDQLVENGFDASGVAGRVGGEHAISVEELVAGGGEQALGQGPLGGPIVAGIQAELGKAMSGVHDHRLASRYEPANQQAAKRAADTLNQLTRSNFARLVISDEPTADRVLRQAASERTSLAIVSVRMVTEGFDCPAISTIAYASNVVADLTIAQTMARAMRITDAERSLAKVLPAQILIPDHGRLKASFTQALVGRMHLISGDSDSAPTLAGDGAGGSLAMPRYQVVDLTGPVLLGATVVGAPDGEVLADELADWNVQLATVGVPLTYTPNIVVASRQVPQFPRIYSDALPESAQARSAADPRTLNKMHRQRIKTLAGWMAQHLDHDNRWGNMGWFQNEANDAASIPTGARGQATDTQLAAAEAWMTEKIFQHCQSEGCNPPALLSADDE